MIRLVDTTLRDGSHAMGHAFVAEQVRSVASALDEAGVAVIEVSHGDGLGGSSLHCGFSREPELDLVAAAAETARNARVAVMILPGVGVAGDLTEALNRGAEIVRVAVLCMEPKLASEHLALAKSRGAATVGFMMASHMRTAASLAEHAKALESYGADCVCLADSAGTMLPDDVRARVTSVAAAVEVGVGFHAHNNFGAAIANCVAALEAGATSLDGSLRGFGAGAGNAATELLAVVLERRGEDGGLNAARILDAAEFTLAPLMPAQPFPDRDSVLIGRFGIYSTFLSYARQAAERHGVDVGPVLVELAERQAVVGQEGMADEIAKGLVRR